MANNCEITIDDLVSELNALKESSKITGCALSRTEISVLSTCDHKIVIEFNLNQKDNNCDKKDGNGSDFDDTQKPDNNRNLGVSQKSLKDSKSVTHSGTEDERRLSRSEQKLVELQKGRSYRRTISESNELTTRGILKYTQNWNRRTVSESNCDYVDSDFENYSEINESVDDIYSEDENKPKKNVRFSDNVSKTVFRPNSSIIGRKLKNKKRSKNRKNSKQRNDSIESETKSDDNSNHENNDSNCDQRSRQDSGYDSEEYVHELSAKNCHKNRSQAKAHKQNRRIELETGIDYDSS